MTPLRSGRGTIQRPAREGRCQTTDPALSQEAMTASDDTGSTRQDSIDQLDHDQIALIIEKLQQLREAHERASTTYGELQHMLEHEFQE
jgi:hypothetical protein